MAVVTVRMRYHFACYDCSAQYITDNTMTVCQCRSGKLHLRSARLRTVVDERPDEDAPEQG